MPDTAVLEATESSLAEIAAPLFQRVDWLSFASTFTVVIAVYLWTLAPEVTLGNSGELATAGGYGGIAHPPGYPVWTFYAFLFTQILPFSNVAWRISVSSAIAGAVASGLVALMVSRGGSLMLANMSRPRRLVPPEENWLRLVCGCAAGMGFAFDNAFWSEALIVETDALSMLFFAVILVSLFRWAHRPSNGFLYAAFLLYGLSLHTNLVLAVAGPGLLFIVLFRDPSLGRDFFLTIGIIAVVFVIAKLRGFLPDFIEAGTLMTIWRWHLVIGTGCMLLGIILCVITGELCTRFKTVCACVSLFVLGWFICFCIPPVSMTNPPNNWGYGRTVEGFSHILGRGQYEHLQPVDNLPDLISTAVLQVRLAAKDLGLFYLIAALIPFCLLLRLDGRERGWLLGLLATYTCLAFLLMALLNPPPGAAVLGQLIHFFPAAHLLLALFAGYGLVLLGTICVAFSSRRHQSALI